MRDYPMSSPLDRFEATDFRTTAIVPSCRCAGRCRCGGLVPALLLREIEMECEFYRGVL